MTASPTVEIVLFRLRPSASEDALMRASETVMPELRAMSGFIRRELLRGDDGQWIDTVYWRSRNDAMRAAEIFPSLACAAALMELLDTESLTMLHVAPVRVYS